MHLSSSDFRRSILLLNRNDRHKISAIAIFQIFMGSLDLLGVMTIGLLGALSVGGLQTGTTIDIANPVMRVLNLSDATFQTQAITLGIIAVTLLVGRTVISIFCTRRILFFLSRKGANISVDLISRLLSQPLSIIQLRSTQETLYAVGEGVALVTVQVIGTAVVLVADLSVLLLMAFGLFVVNPITAAVTFFVFFLVGYFLHQFLDVRAGALGMKSYQLNIASSEKIVEVFASYRELVVRNRRDFYARQIGNIRLDQADIKAEVTFLPYVSKYVIETAIVVSALIIALAQFVLQDAAHATATLAIFLAAGTRIAPAGLRIQQGWLTIRTALAQAKPTLDLVDSLVDIHRIQNTQDEVDVVHEGFISEIQITDTSLTYPGKQDRAISNITLAIPQGALVAIIGPSGAGKTTLIDVLLGILNPDVGSISISGLPPVLAFAKWPGAVSYVPQDVVIATGTIRENISLGFPPADVNDELIKRALRVSHLEEFVTGLPQGIDTQVGERGAKISGGQRQRLGIARAMFTQPRLLILDEATSALDGGIEESVAEAILALRGSVTVVLIAHRLSTVKNADIIIYMGSGKILAKGTFDEIRAAIPEFDRQAKLIGL